MSCVDKKPKKIKTAKFNKVNVQHSDNTIVNIKCCNTQTTIIPGYNTENYYKEYIPEHVHSIKCWNCCHTIESINISIPLKYINNIFYIYGNFCSYECGGRYILDHNNDKCKWEYYSLLHLYNNICNHTIGEKITPAPNRLLLKDFGGDMDIQEYRDKFKINHMCDIYLPPIVPIKHNMIILEHKNVNENKHNFKLYRTKPINSTNNIYNTMNLITDTDNDSEILD